MQLESWYITGNGFHFGKHGLGQEQTSNCMPSDSLFAALVSRLAATKGTQYVDEFMEPFLNGSPPFLVSSTFPFAGRVKFFPKPIRSISQGKMDGNEKSLKKIQYISERLFSQVINGNPLPDFLSKAKIFSEGQIAVSEEEIDQLPLLVRSNNTPIWKVEMKPRVTVERSSQKSSIFFTGRVIYAEECGMWFAIRWLKQDEPLKMIITNLFNDLSDAGLGAERSTGFGECTIKPAETIDLPQIGNQPWVNLSRYIPKPDEMIAFDADFAAWSLVNVGGWVDSPDLRGKRRRPINLVSEGALLASCGHDAPGNVVDVCPRFTKEAKPLGHPVYRCGLALGVGVKGGN